LSSPTAAPCSHTVATKNGIIRTERPSDRSAGLWIHWPYHPADATPAPLLKVPRRMSYETRLPHYPALSYSTATSTVSLIHYRRAPREAGPAPAADPWDELERLGKLVASAWKSEKSAVELLLEERR
jgi:hypothetical protein